jgi:hypothetical protein
MRASLTVQVGIALTGCASTSQPGPDPTPAQLCSDGFRNGDETGVDCGGSCAPCATSGACHVDADCGQGRCATGTCVPPVPTSMPLATVSFADAVAYPSGQKPYVLLAADFNGDGRIDLAATNEQEDSISVFINDGTSFRKLDTSFPTGAYATGGTIADVDHNGVPDIITSNYHGNSVSILLGTGTGVLSATTSYPTADGAETSNLAVGDLDNDGNLDVIATNPRRGSMSQLMGRADATLAAAIEVPVGMPDSEPYSVAIGDFDHDGNSDIAIADDRSATIVVRLGNGDGTFRAEVAYPVHGIRDHVAITRDMDLDGTLDLVCANRGSSDVSVLLGRGDGTFREALVSSTGPDTGPYTVAVADFNLDGIPDLITANFMAGNASVLLGTGDGRFAAPIDTGPTGMFPYGIAVGDFNGDGKPDFATANAVSNDVAVKLSTAH